MSCAPSMRVGLTVLDGSADPGGTGAVTDAAFGAREPSCADRVVTDCMVPWEARAGEVTRIDLRAVCAAPAGARWFPIGGPAGVQWDLASATGFYAPDWMEAGRVSRVGLEAWAGGALVACGEIAVRVAGTPVEPVLTLVASELRDRSELRTYRLTTDEFLDAPSRAGRAVEVLVATPIGDPEPRSVPVMLTMHGLDGAPYCEDDGSFCVSLHDPDDTYWWGYATHADTRAPGSADVPDYTLRQALSVVAWVLRTFAAADPARVGVHGSSMGGAGAATAGLLYARHFAWVSAHLGQTIPRNHRPRRLETLATIWGQPTPQLGADPPAPSVWDLLDLTRVLRDDAVAREQFLFLRHGKDDTIIQFGAVTRASPRTGLSMYDALQSLRVGHYAVWDESGHGSDDPTLPARWWHSGWQPLTDETSRLSLDSAFPAFGHASSDEDHGGGLGQEGARYTVDGGFAGDARVARDTGWAGDIAGALNRGLRWDSRLIVDTVPRFSIPLRVLDGEGGGAPDAGFPCTFDRFCGTLPVVVDVTIRRPQAFRLAPGEEVVWALGGAGGTVRADESGRVTVPRIALTTAWQTLSLTRAGGALRP